MMILSTLAPLLLLPFVTAKGGVHKLKLRKLAPAANNPELEGAYLAQKYGAQHQMPLIGAGGAGRQLLVNRPTHNEDGEQLLWTQNTVKGGHGVPLSSTCTPGCAC